MTTDVLPEATTPPTDPPVDGHEGRRDFFRSCAKGGVLSAVLLVPLLLMNGVNFQSDSFTTRFYAAQARAFLHGQWAMSRTSLGFEGFRHDGLWFMYYGPFPALLRMPFVHVIPGVAERMTQAAILVATAIALICAARIVWHVRAIVRGERPVTRQERWWAAAFVFVVGAGSAFTFLTSQAWVYHEAEAWGAALAIASLDAMLTWLRRPSRVALIAASALAWASVLSRGSVGFGPVAALALLTIAVAWPRVRQLLGVTVDVSRRAAVGLAVATFVPIASYCYVNFVKFGNLFVFPTSAQYMSQLNPARRNFLAHSGGSYFSLKFVPTTLVQYFRPDALRINSLLPFFDFPHQPHVFGNVVFDALEPSSSAPSSMPFLFALSCVAFWVVFRRRATGAREPLRVLRIPLLGAVIGAASVLPFGYVAQRYLSDFLPILVLAGAAGLQVALRWSEDRETAPKSEREPRQARWRRPRVAWRALGVLAVLSVLVNVALAVSYHYTSDWTPQEISAPFIALQYRLHSHFPGGAAPHLEHGARLPAQPGPRGTLFVVDGCKGVYWSPGPIAQLAWGPWQAVQRSTAAGEYRLRISFSAPPAGKRIVEPIITRGEPGRLQMIAAFVGPGAVVNFAFSSQGHEDLPRGATNNGFFVGQIEHVKFGKVYDMTAIMDPLSGHVTVRFNGDTAFRFIQFELTPQQSGSYVFPTDKVVFGVNPYDKTTEPNFVGTLERRSVPRPSLCNALGVH